MLRPLNGTEWHRGHRRVYELDDLVDIVPSLKVSKKQYLLLRCKAPLFNPMAYFALSRIAEETRSSSVAAACFIF